MSDEYTIIFALLLAVIAGYLFFLRYLHRISQESEVKISTMEKRYKDRINRLRARDNEQDEALKSFLHDFTAPLGRIHESMEDVLRSDFMNNQSSIDDGYDHIRRRLYKINEETRTISNNANMIRASLSKRKVQSLNLTEILDDCHGEHISLAASKQVDIIFHPPRQDISVRCDDRQLRSIFRNLITNAIEKNNKANGRKVDIFVRTSPGRGNAEVCIRDNGNGMSKPVLKNLMESQDVMNDEIGSTGGLGLGLSLAKSLAKTNGIELRWESEVNKGTSAYVIFKKTAVT